MNSKLKQEVFDANIKLSKSGLVIFTWGNVSAIDDNTKLVAIKPSGVEYDKMTVDDIVVVDLDGNVVEGELSPSSDLLTHLQVYKSFPSVKAVVHTHSTYAVSFAQAQKPIVCLGTTHADYFYGDIMCSRELKHEEIMNDYELNTGNVIVEEYNHRNINPLDCPAILIASHGPFTFGKNADNAVHNAIVLEEVAKMASLTAINNTENVKADHVIIEKHYLRKNGKNAYYGQKK